MRISHGSKLEPKPTDAGTRAALASVSESYLRDTVTAIAIPRHFSAEPHTNKLVAESISNTLRSYGYRTALQGRYANVMASLPQQSPGPMVLVGAHYDSVPRTPGADDNASAVAAMLACAKVIAAHAPHTPVCFVSFNREEDGLIGSTDFVDHLPGSGLEIKTAHILEMVGYCRRGPGSQSGPLGLPVSIPTTGDFLGVIGNKDSNSLVDAVLQQARSYLPDFPVIGLKVYLGLEKHLPVLGRSDHDPFWRAGIPALLWTDTAEFRNPNYHQVTDTPDTLDYSFLQSVTQLLLAWLLSQ